ncbi:MAG: CooT family nickel-binding protein [Butyrivibrio sp.]|nr:CooT family nickel-binding protein [Butyrivibrio sp.]
MCLSTAVNDSKPDEVLMEYVSAINIDGAEITLTDLMGEKKTFKGNLKFADLTGAVIRIALSE